MDMIMEQETYREEVKSRIARQRDFFNTGQTRNVDFRKEQLKKLRNAIKSRKAEILEALRQDLEKSSQEGYLTEVSMVLSEIKLHMRYLSKWAVPEKVPGVLQLFPAKSYIIFEPLGVALILSPWNYPFQLLINPLVGAISAGNCTVLKPSPSSPATNKVIEKMIRETFPPEYICVIEGDGPQTQFILQEKFDFIFFTGSPSFGKEVMRAAAEHLTPVVLELGGKSPCIVDAGCNVEIAARRIAWGKFLNAGQTCIAPDYLLVHRSLEQSLTETLKKYIDIFYGETPALSPYYSRIITDAAFMRLKAYLDEGEILSGGETDASVRFIAPTLMRNIKPGSPLMEEEIFGPVLPVLAYDKLEEAVDYINARPKPLALYYFGEPSVGKEVLKQTSSGGACINDVVMHIANHHLPFGGVGNSGMGKYHGEYSFRVFSNERAVVKSPAKLDMPFRYPPFKYFSILRRFI